MRFGPALALILAGLTLACSPRSGPDNSAKPADAAGPIVSAEGGANGACTLRWNGEAASAEAVTTRGVALVQEAIAAAGGIASLTEEDMPTARIEADADTPYACFGQALTALRRAGFPNAELPAQGGARPAKVALASFSSMPSEVTVTLGAGERFRWNDEAVDLAGLGTRARQLDRGGAPPEERPPSPSGAAAPPPVVRLATGDILLAPAPDLNFASFAAAVRVLVDRGVEPVLP